MFLYVESLRQQWYMCNFKLDLSGFCHFSLVSFIGFMTLPWHSRHVLFSFDRAASSVHVPCALSSACLVSCWSVVFRSRHSCLEFWFRVWVRTQGFFIRHILNYTGYNQKWNVNQVRSAQWTVQKNKNKIKVTQHKSIYINIGNKKRRNKE